MGWRFGLGSTMFQDSAWDNFEVGEEFGFVVRVWGYCKADFQHEFVQTSQGFRCHVFAECSNNPHFSNYVIHQVLVCEWIMCHVPQSNFVFSSVVVCSVPGGHYATQFKMTSPLYQCVKCQSEYTKGKPEIGTCHMCLHPGFHCSVRGQYEPFGRLDHGTVCWECEVPTPSGCAREGCARAVYPRDVLWHI
jgi:hypothetical protein